MMGVRVQVLREAIHPGHVANDWRLCFQWARYVYDDGQVLHGYRFIWRRDDNSLQAARGQARIPSLEDAETLFRIARAEGWGQHDGDSNERAEVRQRVERAQAA